MPPIELQARFEAAVYWAPPQGDVKVDDYGETKVDDPVEIKVQWVTNRRQIEAVFSKTVGIDAMAVVDRDIPIDSKMWLGELADWTGTGSGGQDDEVMYVKAFSSQKDIKGRVTRRTVALSKSKDALPEAA